jgi:hypothetical protein
VAYEVQTQQYIPNHCLNVPWVNCWMGIGAGPYLPLISDGTFLSTAPNLNVTSLKENTSALLEDLKVTVGAWQYLTDNLRCVYSAPTMCIIQY